jgi:hypothetical protein
MNNPSGRPALNTVPAIDQDRFCLPLRIRTRLGPDPAYSARFELTDRISELASVQVIDDDFEPVPRSVAVYVRNRERSPQQRPSAVRFCKIDSSGISVAGLSDAERHQVLSRGWGRLEKRRIRLFMPRDDAELKVCWAILCRAYDSIINSPANLLAVPRASANELPEISRTSLC